MNREQALDPWRCPRCGFYANDPEPEPTALTENCGDCGRLLEIW